MMRASADFGHEEVEAQRIFIVGSGNIGLCLAGLLEARTPTVSTKIIERDRERAEQAAQALNRTMVLHGDALDPDILEEANVRKTERSEERRVGKKWVSTWRSRRAPYH